jgi:hypothetical protein
MLVFHNLRAIVIPNREPRGSPKQRESKMKLNKKERELVESIATTYGSEAAESFADLLLINKKVKKSLKSKAVA